MNAQYCRKFYKTESGCSKHEISCAKNPKNIIHDLKEIKRKEIQKKAEES